jgi:hypothetical protein
MAIPIAAFQSRWRRSSLAETDAGDLVSAACYRRPEHIGIAAVVIPELKFGNVQFNLPKNSVTCPTTSAELRVVRQSRADP